MTEGFSIKDKTYQDLAAVTDHFAPQGRVLDIQAFGNGNINDTFLVTLTSGADKHFILQRINTKVFRKPEGIMQNMRTFTEHIHKRLERFPLGTGRRWEVPRVLLTHDGKDHWIDPSGSFWRAISFVDGANTFDTIQDNKHAGEVGYALGMFHDLLHDLPTEGLVDTLEGFHLTPLYLQHYEEVLSRCPLAESGAEVRYCLKFVDKRKAWAHVLEEAKRQGKLPLRTIHGDPKVNNVMIDTVTKQAVSIIDLDTVKPGLVHYDIGDCLRSGCNPLGEETDQWEMVHFEPDRCRAILQGYLSRTRDFLTGSDYDYLYEAIRLIPFELGLRFLTDYWEGNIYFKAMHKEHNLARALVQFKLAESVESQASTIRSIVQDMR